MIMAVVVAACSNDGSPEDAAKNIINSFASGDTTQVMNSIYMDESDNSPEMKQIVEGKIGMIAAGAKQELDSKGGVKKIETSNVVYNADKTAATIDVTVTYGDGEVDGPNPMDVVKTKEGWKAKL